MFYLLLLFYYLVLWLFFGRRITDMEGVNAFPTFNDTTKIEHLYVACKFFWMFIFIFLFLLQIMCSKEFNEEILNLSSGFWETWIYLDQSHLMSGKRTTPMMTKMMIVRCCKFLLELLRCFKIVYNINWDKFYKLL